MVCPEQLARLVGDSSRGKAGLSLVRPWRMTITKPPCFSSSNVARAGCCATEGANCMALPIWVARAIKRQFFIGAPPSAEHHNERNQITKSSIGRWRAPRPRHLSSRARKPRRLGRGGGAAPRWLRMYSAITDSGAPPHEPAKKDGDHKTPSLYLPEIS